MTRFNLNEKQKGSYSPTLSIDFWHRGKPV